MAEQQNTSEQSPQIFAFGDQIIRTVDQTGEIWFAAVDVCNALGYSNSRDAISKHVDVDDKNTVAIRDGIGNPNKTVISESGLYALIFGSNKPEAKTFKKWVTSEVLPAIRMTGRYDPGDKPAAQPNLVALQQQSHRLIASLRAEKDKEIRRLLYAQLEAVLEKQNLQAPLLDLLGNDAPVSPPEVERFWHVYRELKRLGCDLNHHSGDQLIAINLKEFQQAAVDHGLRLPPRTTLLKTLRLSRSPKFLDANKAVSSVLVSKVKKTWIFELDYPGKEV